MFPFHPTRSTGRTRFGRNVFAVIGAVGEGKSMITAAMSKGLFGDRRFTSEAAELYVPPAVRRQEDRVRVGHGPTERTPPGLIGAERITFGWHGKPYHLVSLAGEDLFREDAIDARSFRALLGESTPVVVIDPFTMPDVAAHSVRANAYWNQQELALPAYEALLLSAKLHWGLDEETLARLHVGFEAVRGLLKSAEFGFNPLKQKPEERYPLKKLGARDAARINQVINDLVSTQGRKNEHAHRVLRDVLPSVERVVVTFSKLDRLAYCPGLSVDLLGVAHRIVPPRHGVLVVTGTYVVMRLRRDEASIDFYDDFSTEAPARLWEAMKAQIREGERRPAWQRYGPAAVAAYFALPLTLLGAGLLGGLRETVWALALAGLAGAQGLAFALGARYLRSRRRPWEPGPTDVAAPSPAEPPAAALPAAIRRRNESLIKPNGVHH